MYDTTYTLHTDVRVDYHYIFIDMIIAMINVVLYNHMID
jgi:hypothetical protein